MRDITLEKATLKSYIIRMALNRPSPTNVALLFRIEYMTILKKHSRTEKNRIVTIIQWTSINASLYLWS